MYGLIKYVYTNSWRHSHCNTPFPPNVTIILLIYDVVCLQYIINLFYFIFNSWRYSHCNRSDSHRVFLPGSIINIIFYSLISANIYFCVHVVIETTFCNVNLKMEDVIVNHIHLFLCSCCHRNNILKCELKMEDLIVNNIKIIIITVTIETNGYSVYRRDYCIWNEWMSNISVFILFTCFNVHVDTNYQCNQCLSPLKSWVLFPLMAGCTWFMM
jgi:hypothetical protein